MKLLDKPIKQRSTKSLGPSRQSKLIYNVVSLLVLFGTTNIHNTSHNSLTFSPKDQSQIKDVQTVELITSSQDHIVYHTKLKTYVGEMGARLFTSSEKSFVQDFMIFTSLTKPDMAPRLHVFYHLTLNLKLHGIDYPEMFKQEEEQAILKAIYFGKLFVYFKIISTAFGAFQRFELDKVIEMEKESGDNKDYNNFMFLYQQHYVSNIVEVMDSILESDKVPFINELKLLLNDAISSKLLKVVLDALFGLEKSLFTEVNTTIKFGENKENLKVKYILTSTKVYRKFLILSFYLVFLHIFEVNEKFEVVNIREELKGKVNGRIVESGVMDKEAFIEMHRNGFLKNCSGLFKYVMELEDNPESSFFEKFGKTFGDCIGHRVFTA